MLRKNRAESPTVDFLTYLFFRNTLHSPNGTPIWTDTTRRLLLEFDPLEAAAFGLEDNL